MKHIFNQPQFGEDWFTYPGLYAEMVRRFPDGSRFVEVGCHRGKSTSFLAVEIANSRKTIELHCIDIWLDVAQRDAFLENMKPVRKYYTRAYHLSSMEAVRLFSDESVDFVFLDAFHSYEAVRDDITHWLPKVRPGGVLAGHDYFRERAVWPGVRKAVDELLTGFRVSEYCYIYEKPALSPQEPQQ